MNGLIKSNIFIEVCHPEEVEGHPEEVEGHPEQTEGHPGPAEG